ncbi:MAG: biopolymer transporter ExbD [Simkania sp.]|nr:biopolymer transporter ExbD [Simkania sp.]
MRSLRSRAQARSSHPEEESLINLTPLIDVVFVVLIMFIIVAPMLELDRIELAQHVSNQTKDIAPVQESSTITIHVHRDNTILLNGHKTSVQELVFLLKEEHRKYPSKTPQLFHDRQAYFETYQSIKNAVELAGFDEMDVILKPG